MNNNRGDANKTMLSSHVSKKWEGLTLEQLRMKRAMALVQREMGRAQFVQKFADKKEEISHTGIRGLLFSKNTVAKLKTADYLLLGWKLASSIIKFNMRKRK